MNNMSPLKHILELVPLLAIPELSALVRIIEQRKWKLGWELEKAVLDKLDKKDE